MTRKFNNLSVFCILFLGIFPCFSGLLAPKAHAQAPQNASIYSEQDMEAYLKSPFNNAKWDPFVKEGFEALDRQDVQTAIEFLRKATTLGCQSPLVFFKMALAYEASGSYYTAVQYYELAREKMALTHPEHRYQKTFDENYGRALYLLGRRDEAVALLEKADSSSYWILKLLGNAATERGEPAKAAAYYERVANLPGVNLSPAEQTELFITIARLYRKQDNKESAKGAYRKALATDPANAEAKAYLKEASPGNSIEKMMEILGNH